MICCQIISEASNYYHIYSSDPEEKVGREGGSIGPIEELNSHFCSYYHLCLVKMVEGKSIPLESPNVEVSSNLHQHGFTLFFISHQGTSLYPSLQIRGIKVISDWLSHWSTQKVILILEIQQKPLYFLCLSEALSTMQVNHISVKYLTLEKKWKE